MNSSTQPITGAVVAEFILLAAIWGASFLFMRIGATEFGPMLTAFLRVLLAALFLLPLLAWRKQLAALRQHAKPALFVGLINSGIPFALFSYAVLHISTGLTSILNATVPLWGALVAWVWLGDRPNASRLLGLAIGFAGVAMLSWEKASFKPGGSGLAVMACLLATLLYGVAASFTRKYLSNVPPLATATGSQIGAALGLALPALFWWPGSEAGGQTMPSPSLQAWLAIVILAVFCTGVAYVLYFRLIERAGAARTLTVTFLIPVFAVSYGIIFLGEKLTGWMLGCGAVIVLGTALASGALKLPMSTRK
jgi:drug/metabolite transporter (DMT)-like permease